jgi:phasin
MNTTLSTDAAADKARDANRKITTPFEVLGLDTAVPEAMRSLAETTVTQTREAYERSKTTLEAGLEAVERSFDALGQGAAALNRKVIEISHRNVSSGFDLAKSLAAAKNLAEIVELQAAYWRNQFGLLMTQAEEVHAASTEVNADMAEPIQQHARHSANEPHKASSAPMAEAEEVHPLPTKPAADTAEQTKRHATHSADELRKAS